MKNSISRRASHRLWLASPLGGRSPEQRAKAAARYRRWKAGHGEELRSYARRRYLARRAGTWAPRGRVPYHVDFGPGMFLVVGLGASPWPPAWAGDWRDGHGGEMEW